MPRRPSQAATNAPSPRRTVRKLDPTRPQSFDEQLWPIHASIVVLGAYAMGLVLAVFHFDDPRFFANAATWLAFLVLVVGGALWSVGYVQNRLFRRTLLLSMVLSLIVHLSLMVAMAWTSVFHNLWQQERPEAITKRPRPEIIVPEYSLWNRTRQERVQEHERPVETGEPAASDQIELTRQPTESQLSPSQLIPAPQNTNPPSPMTPARQASLPSAPRRSDTLAKLSRQLIRAQVRVGRSLDQPIRPRARSRPMGLQAQPAHLAPSEGQPIEVPQMPRPQDQAPQNHEPVQLARRTDRAASQPSLASLPTFERALHRPRSLPQTKTPLLESGATVPQKTDPTSITAHSTLMEKQSTSAPETPRRSVELAPHVATAMIDSRSTAIDAPTQTELSESLTRSPLVPSSPAGARVQEVEAQNDILQEVEQAAPRSSSSQIARRDRPSRSLPDARWAGSAETDQTRPTPSAGGRAVSRTEPSLASNIADNRSLSRAESIAAVSTSNAAVAAESMSADAALPNPAAETEPSRMAMARSSVGVAGIGEASNLERGVAAPDSPVSIASASASRARATQDIEPGPALAPSAPTKTRRLRANEARPRTSMRAESVDMAMVAGDKEPIPTAASAAATIDRASSNAPTGSVTAARGRADIDLGPTRIATDTGRGRAAGGGQPELAAGEQPRALPRMDLVRGKAQLQSESVAASTAAPAGRDLSVAEDPDAAAIRITRARPADPLPTGSTGEASLVDDERAPSTLDVHVAPMRVARSADLPPTDAEPTLSGGGGNSRSGREARTLQLRTRRTSPLPSLAGAQSSSGREDAQPLEAQARVPRRAASGILTAISRPDDIGAAAGPRPVDGDPENVPSLALNRIQAAPTDEGRGLPLASLDRGAVRRHRRPSVAARSKEVKIDPEEFAQNVSRGNDEAEMLEGLDGELATDDPTMNPGGALLVEADLPELDGGAGAEPAVDAGFISRRAREDSQEISLQRARFLRKQIGGAEGAANVIVFAPTKAFHRRLTRKGERPAGERGLPTAKTEAAIELGLVFLSRYQSADGSWSLNNFAAGQVDLSHEAASMVADTAATGFGLLAFLGAGYHHKDDKYQEVVQSGIDFLLKHQKDDGDLYIDQEANSTRSAWLYSHAIASIALCEAYGMTQDPLLREPAQKALEFIEESQHPSRGGWRYSPGYGSDTSVSGWMMMALKSGELAGLQVSKETYEKFLDWMAIAQESDTQPYLFRYNPYAPDTDQQRHGRRPTRAMTAVGLLMRLYTGWQRENPYMINGARVLAQNLPEMGTSRRPRRDTYYWYYATQVMYHMGGEFWEQWNQRLHPLLTETQVKLGPLSGSWNPQTPVPDRWAAHGGRLYVTTMNLLSLEVFYRHLPIYEETAR